MYHVGGVIVVSIAAMIDAMLIAQATRLKLGMLTVTLSLQYLLMLMMMRLTMKQVVGIFAFAAGASSLISEGLAAMPPFSCSAAPSDF